MMSYDSHSKPKSSIWDIAFLKVWKPIKSNCTCSQALWIWVGYFNSKLGDRPAQNSVRWFTTEWRECWNLGKS